MKIEVFVPGPLQNPLNGPHGHWSKHRRWAKDWRERTHHHLWLALRDTGFLPRVTSRAMLQAQAQVPKRIVLTARTGATWDDDNLRAGLKPCRDALKDAGLIHDDGPESGHVFVYKQVIDREHRGVEITVEMREPQ